MTGRGPEPFDDTALRTPGPSRAEAVRTVTTVMRRVPEGRYRSEILAALFQPMKPSPAPHGKSHTQAWQTARTAWNARCRAWVIEQGRVPGREIRAEDQRAYAEATGDYFEAPEETA